MPVTITSHLRLTLFAACMMCIAVQTTSGDDPIADMDVFVPTTLRIWEMPGMSIAVVKHGETVLVRHYGVCNFGTDRIVTSETLFPIASCSKSFLATAVGILINEGKLSWDDPVVKHLPDFELSDPSSAKHVTLLVGYAEHNTPASSSLKQCSRKSSRQDQDSQRTLSRPFSH